jgi:fatty acid desaturase
VTASDKQRLNFKLDQWSGKLPSWLGRALSWLRSPSGRWVRIPVALLLIAGGFVGFLPVLGFWMVPLGLLLLALDIPFLRKPMLKLIEWLERQWRGLEAWWQGQQEKGPRLTAGPQSLSLVPRFRPRCAPGSPAAAAPRCW